MRKLPLLALSVLMCGMLCSGCEKKEPEIPKAPEKTEEKDSEKDPEQTGDTTEEKTPEEENPQTTPEQMSELFKKLTNGVLRGEQAIDVREFHIPQTRADSIYQQFLAETPLLFHLKMSGNIGYRTDIDNPENLEAFLPRYAVNPSHMQDVFPQMEESLAEYYSQLDYRMTAPEIAYTLYQKVCKEVIYGQMNEEYPYLAYSAFSAVGVFLPKKAVCQGYSLSYSLLMNGIGITTDYVTGQATNTQGHVWNRIYIDGNWYHADATFDDASTQRQKNMSSINKYFLCSDELFYTAFGHPRPHTNLAPRIYLKAGTRFDDESCVIRRYDANNRITKTEALYADGNWYYVSQKDEKMAIIKSDFSGSRRTVLRQLQTDSRAGIIDKLKLTQDRIYFIDHLDGSYHICSMNYDGNDFRKEKKISFIEASYDKLKFTQDESQPIHVYKGTVSLKAELLLARLRLLYYHGEDDYFNLEQPQAKELEQLIRKAETFLNDKHTDETQADMLAKELKDKRKSYTVPLSIKP